MKTQNKHGLWEGRKPVKTTYYDLDIESDLLVFYTYWAKEMAGVAIISRTKNNGAFYIELLRELELDLRRLG